MMARRSSDVLARLAAIGYAPGDDVETRLRKATLTLTSATIALLASVWTAHLSGARSTGGRGDARPLVTSLIVLARRSAMPSWPVSTSASSHPARPAAVDARGFRWVRGRHRLVVPGAPRGPRLRIARAATLVFSPFAAVVALSGLVDPWLAANAEPLPESTARLAGARSLTTCGATR
jgi:hypothetical protein